MVSGLPPPSGALAGDLRAFVDAQLGGVLPRSERARARYFNSVVLGARAQEALATLSRWQRPAGKPVIDVGSGLGSFVVLASLRGEDALGVEPGEQELALSRRRAEEAGLSASLFRPGIGERLPAAGGSASAVLVHDVLEHVGDWRRVLDEAHRVLASGGILYVKGPTYGFRFFEPHYRLPWLPLLPAPLARTYLKALDRDLGYFEHLGYRRRGEVLSHLRGLGLELMFPRREKLARPEAIRRAWVRTGVRSLRLDRVASSRLGKLVADNPLQSGVDVIARKPGAGEAR